jgi:hypothetical protein
MNGKTFYIPLRRFDLSDADVASAGPYPSIAGMRKRYWGYECDIARQGSYIFKLNNRHGEGELYRQLYNTDAGNP